MAIPQAKSHLSCPIPYCTAFKSQTVNRQKVESQTATSASRKRGTEEATLYRKQTLKQDKRKDDCKSDLSIE